MKIAMKSYAQSPCQALKNECFEAAILQFATDGILDYEEERDERTRAARGLVLGPLLGGVSWLVLGAVGYATMRLLS